LGSWQVFRRDLVRHSLVLSKKAAMTDAPNSKMTDVYEGSLIRLFRRLEELLRQMAQAGKVMGSDELSLKFEESLSKIRRDIVAAQSLYL
jgi:superfamily II RNA helicase